MLTIPKLSFNEQMRFWMKIDRKSPNECWLWTGKKTGSGRPTVHVRKVQYIAARIMYRLQFDTDPGELFVCHDCFPNPDNILCINPSHLWLGTQAENSQDYFDKGGKPSYGNQRLTDEQQELVKALYSQGLPVEQIAQRFGIHRRTVWHIATQR